MRLGPKALEVAARLCVANRSLKILIVYFSWPLIRWDYSSCLTDGVPILVVDDLSAKHTDWKSCLIIARDLLLHYTNVNFCLICGLDKTL
jgi:hypothetical protein